MEITTQSLFEEDSIVSGDELDVKVECASRHQTSFLVFVLFPGIALLINLVVFAAVLRKAGKLVRQSHVYVHVSSTLAGNVLFSVLSVFQLLSLFFNFGGHPNHTDPTQYGVVNKEESQWWPIHKALLCGMFVIMCGNISLLIDSIRHNTCSNLRTATGHRVHSKEKERKWRKRIFTRRQRSYLLISLLWIIPLVYVALPAAIGWNCASICVCLSECFPSNHSSSSTNASCSRLFPPMKNSWLTGVVTSWIGGVLVTIWLLNRSVGRVKKMWSQSSSTKRCEQGTSDAADDTNQIKLNSLPVEKLNGNHPKSYDSFVSELDISLVSGNESCDSSNVYFEKSFKDGEKETGDQNKEEIELKNRSLKVNPTKNLSSSPKTENTLSNTFSKAKASGAHHRMIEHLRSTRATTFSLRYVIYLTFSFILCTSPTMILLCIDMLSPRIKLNMVVLNSCLMCPFVYCYLCPFILIKCLPGVKNSLSSLVLSVYSTSG